jgi:carbonic anhydrase
MESDFYQKIVQNNKDWVKNKLSLDPDNFKKLEDQQPPPLL